VYTLDATAGSSLDSAASAPPPKPSRTTEREPTPSSLAHKRSRPEWDDPPHKADYESRLQTFLQSLRPLDAKVAARPQHGSVTIQGKGSSWTYTPAKGFVGRDTFTLERDFLSNDQLYVMYFRVTMDVTP